MRRSRWASRTTKAQGAKIVQGERIQAVLGSEKFAAQFHHPTDGRVLTISWDGHIETGSTRA